MERMRVKKKKGMENKRKVKKGMEKRKVKEKERMRVDT